MQIIAAERVKIQDQYACISREIHVQDLLEDGLPIMQAVPVLVE